MYYENNATNSVIKNLDNDLLLRWSTPADTEKIATLTGHVFRRTEKESPNIHMANQMRVVMRGDHPYMTPHDFAVIEDTTNPGKPLVACTCLWQHQWSYAEIPFTAGRPEFVATLPEYRNRGLIRHIFNFIHERSDKRGDLMQGITGIPYFYRQFGYEMVLDLGASRAAFTSLIPAQKADESETCTLRPATLDDVPLIAQLHNENRGNSLLWHETDKTFWHYLVGFWQDPANRRDEQMMVQIDSYPHMILDESDEPVGFVLPGYYRWKRLSISDLGLIKGTNLQKLMPSLLRAIQRYGNAAPVYDNEDVSLEEIIFWLGRNHPLYELMGTAIAPRIDNPYAWYIRVPDVPAFIQHIAPVLEERLARSALAGYSGELLIDLYRHGLRLNFAQGKLTTAEPWHAHAYEDRAPAGFPPLVFLQLLLGYRSLEELRMIFPDVQAQTKVRLLLDTLFPKQTSRLMPLG